MLVLGPSILSVANGIGTHIMESLLHDMELPLGEDDVLPANEEEIVGVMDQTGHPVLVVDDPTHKVGEVVENPP